ncbi:MAG: hypothetical protein E7232_10965, partial [Lachnospiraceae bacterium]|nr:hypothetical protein [Lachnospiraceae bacterium]
MMKKLMASFAVASMIVTMYAGFGYSSDKGAVVVEPVVLKKSALNNLLPKDAKKNSDTVTELDVIICEYGQDTKNWFLGSGMKGSNFVKKFEEENPNIKLNLEVVS